jgi:hypothetical protein
MSITAERLSILKMIENGKITASEGASLLKAISSEIPDTPQDPDLKPFGTSSAKAKQDTPEPSSPQQTTEARWLRVTVTDPQTGQQRVKLNIPIGLVNTGLRMGARFVPNLNKTEYKEFMTKMEEFSRSRQSGLVVDTVTENGEHLSVYVE